MQQTQTVAWRKEADDFIRAFSGAFLFGIPLLLTEEMWSIGTTIGYRKLLLGLLVALGINVLLAYFAGFKRESTFGTSAAQALDAVAVGAIAGAMVLAALGRIRWGDPLGDVLSKIMIQAVPLSIGASVANSVIPREKDRRGREDGGPPPSPWRAALSDLGATAAGAIFVSFAIAPTAEVQLLAGGIDYAHQLALVALTLLVTFAIVFASGFSPQGAGPTGPLQRPLVETTFAYAVSLLIALGALVLFDRITVETRPASALAQVFVLGLPAAVGGAAGRLLA